ncbi:MAG: DegT/DnrJ/EryC1/StrS family aminotransferase [Planctomycetota bacterium]|jgi:dTDP-4-amino-4,6-dideoxygalactose transaminase
MRRFEEPILVTRPFLPPLAAVQNGLAEVWANQWLTNNGPVLAQFESHLLQYCQAPAAKLFANGTLAMELAFRALGLTAGEVITTPFTFVATANAIENAGLKPVFVDIRADDYTIDPVAVEQAVTDHTVAIAPVHVFGSPCRHEAIERIAEQRSLRIVYDAAHAFGVTVDGQSIGLLGDVSMVSLHATKLLHSVEGGMLISRDSDLLDRAAQMANFGIAGKMDIVGPATNAKMSELHALVGRECLKYADDIIRRRQEQVLLYRSLLANAPGIRLPVLPEESTVAYNYAYMPIEVVADEFGRDRDGLAEELNALNVFPREYFFPLLTDTEAFREAKVAGDVSVARTVAGRVLCLPVYHTLDSEAIERICGMVCEVGRG